MTAETGTYRWMAPEVINHLPYDQKADVFSFAIVLWELVTAKVEGQTEEVIFDHLHATAFEYTPLGRTILGPAENVKTIGKEHFQIYISAHYTVVGTGQGGGVLVYEAVLAFNAANNVTVVFDNATVSTYSYVGTDWIGYDDTTSIEYKVKFAKAQDLGGYFFWAFGDDSNWSLAITASAAWDNED